MLATFACSGATPANSSAGYETSDVIPPAVPTRPATAPAPTRNSSRAAGFTGAPLMFTTTLATYTCDKCNVTSRTIP